MHRGCEVNEHDHELYQPHAHPGLPWPPPPGILDARVRGFVTGQPAGSTPHFWTNGPIAVRPLLAPRTIRTHGGGKARVTHEVPWFLDRVEGMSRSAALRRLYDVLLDPDGWVQVGVHWKRVLTREAATILVRVIPQDSSVCGPGSAGCYSYGFEPDGKPVAECGIESIGHEGPWRIIVGMELCGHGSFKMEDMYTPDHIQGYVGSMGTWEAAAKVGFRPTSGEIIAARQWLDGKIDPALVHHQ